MDVIRCRCTACGAEFAVGSQYAGQRVRCVKCREAVAVARPPAPPAMPTVAPEPAAEAEPSLGDLLGLDSQTPPGRSVAYARRQGASRSRRKPTQVWAIAIPVGAVALVAVGVLAAMIAGRSNSPSPESAKAASKTAATGSSASATSASVKTQKSSEDQFAIVAPQQFVDPGKFDSTSPPTQPGGSAPKKELTDKWLQDFDEAKRVAQREHKSVLVFFTGSDWCGFCKQLTGEVFASPEFETQAAKEFVLVFIDSPHGPEAKAKVQDAGRNGRLVGQFGVQGFPMVILTDDKGRVFSELPGYRPGGVASYVAELSRRKKVSEKLQQALDQIASDESKDGKRDAAKQALEFVRQNGLAKYYGGQIKEWEQLAGA